MMGRKGLLCAALAFTISPSSLWGQVPVHDYDGRIEEGIRSIGGYEALSTATWDQVRPFVSFLVLRGEFYYDLYRFQLVLQRDYARLRDTIPDSIGVRVPEARFFEAHALVGLGDRTGAARLLGRLEASVDAGVRTEAGSWASALKGQGSWPTAYLSWASAPQEGLRRVNCPGNSDNCRLFAAIAAGDRAEIAWLSSVLSVPEPAFTRAVTFEEIGFDIEFYDALRTRLLSLADFALAAALLENIDIQGVPELRNHALARLRDAAPPSSSPLTNREFQGALKVRMELERGNYGAALDDADAALRPVFGRGLDALPPSLSIVHAHAVYVTSRRVLSGEADAGRQRYKEARSALDALAPFFPAVDPARRMLQELTDPNRVVGGVRIGF